MKASPKQVGYIKGLMAQKGILDESATLALSFSNDRTEHVSDLYKTEADALIKKLLGKSVDPFKPSQKAQTMRRKMISMAWEMGWINTHSDKPKADVNRIDAWCKKYGHGHKALNDYTTKELPTLISQFERMHKQYMENV